MNNFAPDRLAVVATFLESNQAHTARFCLEAEGIRAALDGEHHSAMEGSISNAIGGVKLLVHERDAEAAKQILHASAQVIPDEHTGDDTDTETRTAHCPSCASASVYRERLRRRFIFLSILLLGIPIPFFSRKMTCETCGHRWSNH